MFVNIAAHANIYECDQIPLDKQEREKVSAISAVYANIA